MAGYHLEVVGSGAGNWREWFRFGTRGAPARVAGEEEEDAPPAFGCLPRPQEPSEEDLPAAGRAAVQHVLDVLNAAGVLTGPPPDPVFLYPALVEEGPPVRVEGVLSALWEADAVYAGVRLEDCARNLVRHESQVEQFADYLEQQVADLAGLTAGDLAIVLERIEQSDTAGGLRTRAWLTIGGDRRVLDYLGRAKSMSTVIHVEIARALLATGSSRRLAWLWSDQGPWITALTTGVEELNAALGIHPDDPGCFSWWEWVDQDSPMAAGEATSAGA
jgi:hypothetical protein